MFNEKGNILISLLFVLILLSILSVGAYRISYSAIRDAEFIEDNTQSYYIAKAGADIVIDYIIDLRKGLEKNNNNISNIISIPKEIQINFPERGTAYIDIKSQKDNSEITIKSTGIVNEGKRYESKSRIQADLIFSSNIGDSVVFGVDSKGNVYEFDREFLNTTKINIKTKDGKNLSIKDPKCFAWNTKDNTLILVGGNSGNSEKEPDTLIYNLGKDSGDPWIEPKKHTGNGFRQAIYSEEMNLFYGLSTKSDKINRLESNEWKEKINNTNLNGSFKLEKFDVGKNTVIGIFKDNKNNYKLAYYDGSNKKFAELESTIYDKYNSIEYGAGKFVVAGKNNDEALFLTYSYANNVWSRDIIQFSDSKEIIDIVWIGDKFVAFGRNNSDSISTYTSNDGIKWDRVSKLNLLCNYSHISGYKDYLVIYSEKSNVVLISKDSGKNWFERELNDVEGTLVDLIVVNRGAEENASKDYSITWSK